MISSFLILVYAVLSFNVSIEGHTPQTQTNLDDGQPLIVLDDPPCDNC